MNIIKTLAAAALLLISTSASTFGRGFEPTTKWPYLFEDFHEACVTNFRGIEINHDKLNINLIKGRAHYLQNEKLMEVDMGTITTLKVGEDTYVPASGRLVKVIKSSENGTVALSTAIDMEKMSRPEASYGGSSVASVQSVNPWATGGMAEIETINDISKSGGDPLILKETKGIVYKRMFYLASKNVILNIPGIDKDAVKKFMKDNKIRLMNDDDLLKLAEFISTF